MPGEGASAFALLFERCRRVVGLNKLPVDIAALVIAREMIAGNGSARSTSCLMLVQLQTGGQL